ncbi:CHAT domain-containing protein [Catellatospora citrea]|uniref:CHAT domain-containing protein n=1 Tax=Catellatospora citrea TaxID=53366 RepID=UPI0033C2FF3A
MRRAERRRETQRLTKTINACLQAYRDDGDAAHLSGGQILADAAALVRLHSKMVHGGALQARFARILFGGFSRLGAIVVLAELYWARYQDESIGGGREGDDYYAAASLYSVIFYLDRSRVPEQLHDLMLAAEAHKGIGPDDWAERAMKVMLAGWETGDASGLAKAVGLARMAYALYPEGAQRVYRAGVLGVVRAFRFEVVRVSKEELDQAIADLDEVRASAGPATQTELVDFASALLLGVRFERSGAVADLDEGLRLLDRHVETVNEQAMRAHLQGIRSYYLTKRFEFLGERHDIEAAMRAGRVAVTTAPEGDPDRPLYQNNLALALATRYAHYNEVAELDEAIVVGRQALAGSKRPLWITRHQANLGHYLIQRYFRTGSIVDLDEVVDQAGRALEGDHTAGPSRSLFLGNLGAGLLARYEALGRAADLNRVIDLSREAITITPDGDILQQPVLSMLSQALVVRFEALGVSADLEDAVEAGLRAVAAAKTLPYRFEAYTNLARAMAARYAHSDDPADLEQALEYHRRAMESTPADSPGRALACSNLCVVLINKYVSSRSKDDLDGALNAGELAMAVELPVAANRGVLLANLGVAYTLRFSVTRSPADLERAITLCEESLRVTSANHPSRARRLLAAGRAMLGRAHLVGDPAALAAGLERLQEAITCRTAPAGDRISAAEEYGAVAAAEGRWREAADALRQGVELLPLVALRGMERVDGERLIIEWPALASDAAACAINAGDLTGALEVLENGRAVLWSQRLDTETDLSLLQSSHPGLADELVSIRAELNRDSEPVTGTRGGAGLSQARIDQIARLGHRWDELVAQVRVLPGFESFLMPVPAGTILATLPARPVVILNVSRWRCDAIVLRDDAVTVVGPLACAYGDVVDHANGYITAFDEFEQRKTHVPTRLKLEEVVETTLDWLWRMVAAPVLDELGYGTEPDPGQPLPRVWWCPTGPLTVLPVHAAGRTDDVAVSALNRVVSSYTPTLRALRNARPTVAADGRLLVVGVSEAAGAEPLSSVATEIDTLRRLLPPDRIEVLEGPSASRLVITAKMRDRAFVHFSCHGSQDLGNPSQACILAYDGTITLTELASSHGGGELVTLSACMTATGGAAAADEVVSLAAAMHYTGWRQVVATLWWVWDDAASMIMSDLYRHITSDGTIRTQEAARALNQAVREHRTAYPRQPTRWAPFIHIGSS